MLFNKSMLNKTILSKQNLDKIKIIIRYMYKHSYKTLLNYFILRSFSNCVRRVLQSSNWTSKCCSRKQKKWTQIESSKSLNK